MLLLAAMVAGGAIYFNRSPGQEVGFVSFEELAQQHPSDVTILRPAGDAVDLKPMSIGEEVSNCTPVTGFPPIYAAYLPNGICIRNGSRIHTEDGRTLVHTSNKTDLHLMGPVESWKARPARYPSIPKFEKTVAVVASYLSNENYFHFLTEELPRLYLLQHSDLQFDEVYVGENNRVYHTEGLKALGLSTDDLLTSGSSASIQADRLLVTSLPTLGITTPKWVLSLLRDLFLPTDVKRPHRRIYISRGDAKWRRILNEEDLITQLKPLGFEVVTLSGLSIAEQARLFAEAEVVVAPHGAALTNIVFSQPDTKLVELFHPNFRVPCFQRMAQIGGVKHVEVLGVGDFAKNFSGQWQRLRTTLGLDNQLYDYTVSVEEVRKALEA